MSAWIILGILLYVGGAWLTVGALRDYETAGLWQSAVMVVLWPVTWMVVAGVYLWNLWEDA